MKRLVPYAVFAMAYAGLIFLVGSVMNWLIAGDTVVPGMWGAPFVAAPLALLLAERSGTLTRAGVALTSLILVLCFAIPATVMLTGLAVAIPENPSVPYISQGMILFIQLGKWLVWISGLEFVVIPWVCALLLQWHYSRKARAAVCQ